MAASVSTPTTMPPIPAATAQIHPQLLQLVQRMPADQQAQAMRELQGMNPAQQQQLLAQVTQAQAQAAPQPGSPAAAAQTGPNQATLGASAAGPNPPSLVKNLLKNAAIFGGVGAALGFGASFLPIPGLTLGAPILAAIGGGVGAVVGLVKGFLSHRKQSAEFTAQAEAAAQQQAAAAQAAAPAEPAAADSLAPVAKPAHAAAATAADGGSYTVKKGDTLSAIAKRHDMSWKELYAANRQAVGPNPNMIHPGLKLVIPE